MTRARGNCRVFARGCMNVALAHAQICQWCGRAYIKCEVHGGDAAAARSLRSHLGLCMKKPESEAKP